MFPSFYSRFRYESKHNETLSICERELLVDFLWYFCLLIEFFKAFRMKICWSDILMQVGSKIRHFSMLYKTNIEIWWQASVGFVGYQWKSVYFKLGGICTRFWMIEYKILHYSNAKNSSGIQSFCHCISWNNS